MASSLPMAPLDQAFTLMSDQIKIGTQPGPAVKPSTKPSKPKKPSNETMPPPDEAEEDSLSLARKPLETPSPVMEEDMEDTPTATAEVATPAA